MRSDTTFCTGTASYSPTHEVPESALYAEDPAKLNLNARQNYFSSVLLVPPRWLRKDVKDGIHTEIRLANRYQVSQEVIFIALEQHRLLNRVGRRRR